MKFLPAILLFLLASCASAPPPANPAPEAVKPQAVETPKPEPAPVKIDRSAETDYDLRAYATRIAKADEYALEGKRTAGAFVLSGIKLRLDESAKRERLFLDLKLAELWGGPSFDGGEARNEQKALALIQDVEAVSAADARLLADAQVARAVVALGAENLARVESAFLAAMTQYEAAGAFVRSIDAARQALRVFFKREDDQRALRFARLGYQAAQDLDKPGALCLVSLDCAMLSFRAGAADAAAHYLEDAYAAALKTENLRYVNAVIAQAVLEFWGQRDFVQAARWGDALRQDGEFPEQAASGLAPYEYARTLCLYALALNESAPDSTRLQPALKAASEAALGLLKSEGLPEPERKEIGSLSEKVNSALLKTGGG